MMTTSHTIFISQATIDSSDRNQPYTQYHITLQLPLRKVKILKRFSEFEALHLALTKETKLSPPIALPPKLWFRRTVSSPSLTEHRRNGLERYVRAIVNAEDKRWRSSVAWKSFISPSSNVVSPSARTQLHQQDPGDSSVTPLSWLEQQRELKILLQNVRHQIKQKEDAKTPAQQHLHAADAKVNMVRAAVLIARLESGLNQLSSSDSVGSDSRRDENLVLGTGELRRRRDLLAAAKSEIEGLEYVLNSIPARDLPSVVNSRLGDPALNTDKDVLWDGVKSTGRVLGGHPKETQRTRELENSGVLQLQQQILRDQDEDVLALGKTVARLKDMGIMINEELVVQNEMLGLLEEDADRVEGKINVAKRRINDIK